MTFCEIKKKKLRKAYNENYAFGTKKLVDKSVAAQRVTKYKVNMNFIKNTLVYLLLLVFDVKTVVNDAEKLEICVTKTSTTFTETNESSENLLKLIDQSSVILKAFCSENLINFAEDEDEEMDEKGSSSGKNDLNDADDDEYNDYYFYKNSVDKNLKTLMTFTPTTIYKGTNILRQLELFNNQQYFLIKGWVEDRFFHRKNMLRLLKIKLKTWKKAMVRKMVGKFLSSENWFTNYPRSKFTIDS